MNDLCLAKFGTIYETGRPKNVEFIGQVSKEKIDAYDIEVPKWILLKDGTHMKARITPAVLRMHASKRKKGHEEQYSEMLLFLPWRNESELFCEDADKAVDLFTKNIQTILNNRKAVLPFSSMVSEMKELLDNPTENRSKHLHDILDSTMEQEADDDQEVENEIPADDTIVVFEEDAKQEVKVDKCRFKIPVVDDDETMRSLARSLSTEQREVFDIFVDYMKKLVSSKKTGIFNEIPPQIIATGGAGVGKSFLIIVLVKFIEKILRLPGDHPEKPKVALLAPTGIAASLIGGTTIQTGLSFKFGRDYLPLNDQAREQIRVDLDDLQLIVIDEMSMISADALYMIHQRLCEIFVSQDPFAGKAMLCVGDLLQLRPVKGKYIFAKPKSPRYKPLYEVDPLWHGITPVVLKTNFRQGEGNVWTELLNRARLGEMTAEDMLLLEQRRVSDSIDTNMISEAFHVFFTNKETHKWNMKKLNQLPSKVEVFRAKIFSPKGYKPTISEHDTIDDTQMRKTLYLKIGAKVMMTLNVDTSDSLVNGSIGHVKGFIKKKGSNTSVLVQFDVEEVGKKYRVANKHLLSDEFPNATPIFPSTLEYVPRKKSG